MGEQDAVTGVRDDEQVPAMDLTRERGGLRNGHERVAIAGRDERRRCDAVQVAGTQERLGLDVGGDRREQPAPRASPLDRIMEASQFRRPGAVVTLDPLRVHRPTGDGRPWLAIGCDPRDDQAQDALRTQRGERQRGHPAHREPDQMEGLESQGVGERLEVVDEVRGREAIGRVPARRSMTACVGQMDAEPAD